VGIAKRYALVPSRISPGVEQRVCYSRMPKLDMNKSRATGVTAGSSLSVNTVPCFSNVKVAIVFVVFYVLFEVEYYKYNSNDLRPL